MDEFTSCAVCKRTPLVGEGITVMNSGGSESAVCDLCLERPRTAALGEAVRRDRIRSGAGAATVRRSWPVPAAETQRTPATVA
jgi:hypothetical protein